MIKEPVGYNALLSVFKASARLLLIHQLCKYIFKIILGYAPMA